MNKLTDNEAAEILAMQDAIQITDKSIKLQELLRDETVMPFEIVAFLDEDIDNVIAAIMILFADLRVRRGIDGY